MELNIKDKKILGELANNARLPFTILAKKVKLSREVVKYRVQRLIQLKVIENFIAVINVNKLGYSTYHFYIQLQKCSQNQEKEIITFLADLPLTTFVSTCIGEWDLIVECYAKDIIELNDQLREINYKFSEYVKNIKLNTVLQEFACNPKSIYHLEENFKEIKLKKVSEREVIPIDKKELQILKILSKNARTTAMEIAKEVSLSSDAINYRIKNSIKRKVIKGYKTIINTSKLGYHRYIITLELMNSTLNDEKMIISFFRNHPNVLYVMKTMGICNLLVDLVAEDSIRFREILMEIRGTFGKFINDYNALMLFTEYKNEYFPSGIKTE